MLLNCAYLAKDLSRYTETSNVPEVKEKSINQMANSRQEKIARYKEQKEQERRLKVKIVFNSHLRKFVCVEKVS